MALSVSSRQSTTDMMTSTSPKFHLLSESGLRVGHLNVYHLLNKVPDISSFLNNEHPCIHLLGLSETRLDYRMSDKSIAIPQYLTLTLFLALFSSVSLLMTCPCILLAIQ